MSSLRLLPLLLLPTSVAADAGIDEATCTFRGKTMKGKVQVVDSFPDLKVQVVNSFPDKAGKWQIVNSFPDYKIQIVNSFPDFKVQYVNSFPGVP